MFIHFFCLCPLGLATKLNFNISKEAYLHRHQAKAIYAAKAHSSKHDNIVSIFSRHVIRTQDV